MHFVTMPFTPSIVLTFSCIDTAQFMFGEYIFALSCIRFYFFPAHTSERTHAHTYSSAWVFPKGPSTHFMEACLTDGGALQLTQTQTQTQLVDLFFIPQNTWIKKIMIVGCFKAMNLIITCSPPFTFTFVHLGVCMDRQ